VLLLLQIWCVPVPKPGTHMQFFILFDIHMLLLSSLLLLLL
jgi:hypothetical protein